MTDKNEAAAIEPGRRRWLGLGSVGVLAAASGGWWFWQRQRDAEAKAHAPILATVQRGTIEEFVTASGSLQPVRYVDVGAQVSGQLRHLHVQVGSEVQKGDLLAEIDADAAAAKVDAYRASVRQQRANLAQQEVALEKALRDLERQRKLMADEATTNQELVDAQSTARTAQAQVEATRAQIEQIEATMRVEQTNLAYTRIDAPITGTVVSITARQGQTLNASQAAPTILRVADLSTMSVQTQVSEADVGRLYGGMPVYFTTLGGQGQRWWGKLKQIEPTPTVTNNVVLYNAVFEAPNVERKLMTQMTAQVFFVAQRVENVLTVPVAALVQKESALKSAQAAPGGAATPPSEAASGGRQRRRGGEGAQGQTEAGTGSSGERPERAERGNRAERPPAVVQAAPVPVSPPALPATTPGGEDRRSGERMPPRGEGRPAEGWGQRPDFANMTEEERQQMRAQRRREREAAEAAGAAPAPARRAESPAPAPAPVAPAAPRAQAASRPAGKAPSPNTSVPQPIDRGVWAGPVSKPRAVQPRRAVVKVVNEQGAMEEREVLVGATNRVHAQVLQGLNEGDKVVVGQRQPEGNRQKAGNDNQDRNRPQQGSALGMGAGAGMGPGPMGPGR